MNICLGIYVNLLYKTKTFLLIIRLSNLNSNITLISSYWYFHYKEPHYNNFVNCIQTKSISSSDWIKVQLREIVKSTKRTLSAEIIQAWNMKLLRSECNWKSKLQMVSNQSMHWYYFTLRPVKKFRQHNGINFLSKRWIAIQVSKHDENFSFHTEFK